MAHRCFLRFPSLLPWDFPLAAPDPIFYESLFLGSSVAFFPSDLLPCVTEPHLSVASWARLQRGKISSVYPRALSSCSVPWEAGIYEDDIGSLLAIWLPVDSGQWEIRKLNGRERKSGSLFSSSHLFELWVGGGHCLCQWLSAVTAALSSLGNSTLWELPTLGSHGAPYHS